MHSEDDPVEAIKGPASFFLLPVFPRPFRSGGHLHVVIEQFGNSTPESGAVRGFCRQNISGILWSAKFVIFPPLLLKVWWAYSFRECARWPDSRIQEYLEVPVPCRAEGIGEIPNLTTFPYHGGFPHTGFQVPEIDCLSSAIHPAGDGTRDQRLCLFPYQLFPPVLFASPGDNHPA